MYQDNRDAQQIADDSVAFLRTFSLRLKRFRAQVGEFAHANQSSSHTDNTEMSDNDFTKPTTTTASDTKLNESLPADEQDDSLDEHPTYTHKLCGQCEPSRAELPDTTPQSPIIQTDRIPPCPDDTPDHPFPEDTYATTRTYNTQPSLRGTYIDEYLKRTYATVRLERDNPHLHDPPVVVDDNGGDADDEFNDGINPTVNQQPAPYEPETMKAIYEETLQLTGDTQRTTHTKQKIHKTTPPGQPGPGSVTPSREQTKHTTNLRARPIDITRNHKADPPRHKKVSTTALIAKETEKTIHDLIRTQDTTERDIEGLVPDRGKKPGHRTGRVSVIYMPT